jgi:hypothetical protein
MPSQKEIDRTRGGRLVGPAPEEMFQTSRGDAYWQRVNKFIDYMDSVLPASYSFSSTSGYRPNSRDRAGNLIGTGSHKRPAFDFIVNTEDPDSRLSRMSKDDRWSLYLDVMQPMAQYFGMEADGRKFLPVEKSKKYPKGLKPHGDGPHLHTQSTPESRRIKPLVDDPERLEKLTQDLLARLGLSDDQEVAQYKRGGKVRDAYGRSLI